MLGTSEPKHFFWNVKFWTFYSIWLHSHFCVYHFAIFPPLQIPFGLRSVPYFIYCFILNSRILWLFHFYDLFNNNFSRLRCALLFELNAMDLPLHSPIKKKQKPVLSMVCDSDWNCVHLNALPDINYCTEMQKNIYTNWQSSFNSVNPLRMCHQKWKQLERKREYKIGVSHIVYRTFAM